MRVVKKILKALGIILLLLIVLILVGAWSMFGEKVKGANSIKKISDNLYTLDYKGDYGFDGFIDEGGSSTDAGIGDYMIKFLSNGYMTELSYAEPQNVFACTAFRENDAAGENLVGRNFDWNKKSDTMIVHTKSKTAYESYSTCNMEFLGFGKDFVPDESMMNKFMSLATIYVPQDGINEKGLVVIDLIDADGDVASQSSSKPDLTTCTAIRLLLDRAATVDEAIDLLNEFDMNSSIGTSHHLFISDAYGKSVVVEYIKNDISVVESELVTNFDLTKFDRTGAYTGEAFARYDRVKAAIDETSSMEAEDVKNILSTIAHYDETRWSIVYNTTKPEFDFYFGDYNTAYHYSFSK